MNTIFKILSNNQGTENLIENINNISLKLCFLDNKELSILKANLSKLSSAIEDLDDSVDKELILKQDTITDRLLEDILPIIPNKSNSIDDLNEITGLKDVGSSKEETLITPNNSKSIDSLNKLADFKNLEYNERDSKECVKAIPQYIKDAVFLNNKYNWNIPMLSSKTIELLKEGTLKEFHILPYITNAYYVNSGAITDSSDLAKVKYFYMNKFNFNAVPFVKSEISHDDKLNYSNATAFLSLFNQTPANSKACKMTVEEILDVLNS